MDDFDIGGLAQLLNEPATKVAIFDRDPSDREKPALPPWADRVQGGSVDYLLKEPLGLRLRSDASGARRWQITGLSKNSAVSDFFDGVADSGAKIHLDVWADKALNVLAGHKLGNGDLLVLQANLTFLRTLLRTAPDGLECVSDIDFWLEDSSVARSETYREGFDKGSFFIEMQGSDGKWNRQTLFDAKRHDSDATMAEAIEPKASPKIAAAPPKFVSREGLNSVSLASFATLDRLGMKFKEGRAG